MCHEWWSLHGVIKCSLFYIYSHYKPVYSVKQLYVCNSLPACVQVWFAIFQLLLSEETRNKYEMNSFRKNILLKVKCWSLILYFSFVGYSISSLKQFPALLWF